MTYAIRRAELILPKLQHMKENSKNGDVLHDIGRHIALIKGNVWLLSHSKKVDQAEIEKLIVEICDEAEQFMAEAAW